jgi:hypothetical protein
MTMIKQVGDHHYVDQRQDDQHDDRFIERSHRHIRLVADAGHEGLQSGLVTKCCFKQVNQLHPEVKNINTLSSNQADIQG